MNLIKKRNLWRYCLGISFQVLMGTSQWAQGQANPISDYIIDKELVGGDCSIVGEGHTPQQAEFREVVCLWHENISSHNISKIADNARIMQRLQTQGLYNAQHALMALLEGLSHCQMARIDLPDIDDNSSSRTRFCSSRLNAINTLSSIPWRFAQFNYSSDVEGASLGGTLIDGMAACYEQNAPLNTQYDGTCGIYQGVSPARQLEIADEEYEEVASRYFLATSPINDLFVKKQQLAAGIYDRSLSRKEALENKVSKIQGGLSYVEETLLSAVARINTSIKNYKESYAIARSVLERYEEWSQGLLVKKVDGQDTDFSQILIGPQSTPTSEEVLNAEYSVLNGSDGLLSTIGQAMEAISSRQASVEAQQGALIKMCQVFFCHLYAAPGPWDDDYFTKACQTSVLENTGNALCKPFELAVDVDSVALNFSEFCQEIGFASEFNQLRPNADLIKDSEGQLLCQARP